MIEEHVAAEVEALRRVTDLVERVAGDTRTTRVLRVHAGDLANELGRVRTWRSLENLREAAGKLRAEALSYTQGCCCASTGSTTARARPSTRW